MLGLVVQPSVELIAQQKVLSSASGLVPAAACLPLRRAVRLVEQKIEGSPRSEMFIVFIAYSVVYPCD